MHIKLIDPQPFGQLASAACAVALALRLRGRKDDQDWATLLDRLGRSAKMYLAGQGKTMPFSGDEDRSAEESAE